MMDAKQVESQARGIAEDANYGPPQEFTLDSWVGGKPPSLPGHRMSGVDVKLTVRRLRAVLRWLKIDQDQYMAWSGNQRPQDFIAENPDWTARAFEVILLENLSVIKSQAATPSQNRTKVIA